MLGTAPRHGAAATKRPGALARFIGRPVKRCWVPRSPRRYSSAEVVFLTATMGNLDVIRTCFGHPFRTRILGEIPSILHRQRPELENPEGRTALEGAHEARGATGAAGPVGGRSGQEPLHMRVDWVGVKRIARGEGASARDDACENPTATHSFWDVTLDREGA